MCFYEKYDHTLGVYTGRVGATTKTCHVLHTRSDTLHDTAYITRGGVTRTRRSPLALPCYKHALEADAAVVPRLDARRGRRRRGRGRRRGGRRGRRRGRRRHLRLLGRGWRCHRGRSSRRRCGRQEVLDDLGVVVAPGAAVGEGHAGAVVAADPQAGHLVGWSGRSKQSGRSVKSE